jgi:hypothetical protein
MFDLTVTPFGKYVYVPRALLYLFYSKLPIIFITDSENVKSVIPSSLLNEILTASYSFSSSLGAKVSR